MPICYFHGILCLEGRITLPTIHCSLAQKNKQKWQCEFTSQVQALFQVGKMSGLENLDVISMCSVFSWYPIGCNCPLPSSTSPGEIPESEPHFASHQWEGKTSKDLPLLERNKVIVIISDSSSKWMYKTFAELEMWHKEAQMQTVLYYPKPLCTAFFLFLTLLYQTAAL